MLLCYALSTVQYCKLILPPLSLTTYVVLGTMGSAAAVFGDLVESMMKRAGVVKDSSKVLGNALGGMLDRVDSLCASFPVMYYIYQVML